MTMADPREPRKVVPPTLRFARLSKGAIVDELGRKTTSGDYEIRLRTAPARDDLEFCLRGSDIRSLAAGPWERAPFSAAMQSEPGWVVGGVRLSGERPPEAVCITHGMTACQTTAGAKRAYWEWRILAAQENGWPAPWEFMQVIREARSEQLPYRPTIVAPIQLDRGPALSNPLSLELTQKFLTSFLLAEPVAVGSESDLIAVVTAVWLALEPIPALRRYLCYAHRVDESVADRFAFSTIAAKNPGNPRGKKGLEELRSDPGLTWLVKRLTTGDGAIHDRTELKSWFNEPLGVGALHTDEPRGKALRRSLVSREKALALERHVAGRSLESLVLATGRAAIERWPDTLEPMPDVFERVMLSLVRRDPGAGNEHERGWWAQLCFRAIHALYRTRTAWTTEPNAAVVEAILNLGAHLSKASAPSGETATLIASMTDHGILPLADWTEQSTVDPPRVILSLERELFAAMDEMLTAANHEMARKRARVAGYARAFQLIQRFWRAAVLDASTRPMLFIGAASWRLGAGLPIGTAAENPFVPLLTRGELALLHQWERPETSPRALDTGNQSLLLGVRRLLSGVFEQQRQPAGAPASSTSTTRLLRGRDEHRSATVQTSTSPIRSFAAAAERHFLHQYLATARSAQLPSPTCDSVSATANLFGFAVSHPLTRLCSGLPVSRNDHDVLLKFRFQDNLSRALARSILQNWTHGDERTERARWLAAWLPPDLASSLDAGANGAEQGIALEEVLTKADLVDFLLVQQWKQFRVEMPTLNQIELAETLAKRCNEFKRLPDEPMVQLMASKGSLSAASLRHLLSVELIRSRHDKALAERVCELWSERRPGTDAVWERHLREYASPELATMLDLGSGRQESVPMEGLENCHDFLNDRLHSRLQQLSLPTSLPQNWQSSTAALLEFCSAESSKRATSGVLRVIPYLFRGGLEADLIQRTNAPQSQAGLVQFLSDWWNADRLMRAAGISKDVYLEPSPKHGSLYHLIYRIVLDERERTPLATSDATPQTGGPRLTTKHTVTTTPYATHLLSPTRAAPRPNMERLLPYRRSFRAFCERSAFEPCGDELGLLLDCGETLREETLFSRTLPGWLSTNDCAKIAESEARFLFGNLRSEKRPFTLWQLFQSKQESLKTPQEWSVFIKLLIAVIERHPDPEQRTVFAKEAEELASNAIQRNIQVSTHSVPAQNQRQRTVTATEVVLAYRAPVGVRSGIDPELFYLAPRRVPRNTNLENIEADFRRTIHNLLGLKQSSMSFGRR
jgi:hypothetical protein